jgi:D-sedoheptulose 7-phosphate isomerase
MKDVSALIDHFVSESLRVKARFFDENKARIVETAETIAHGLRNGRKMLLFGNGGSAADSQHLAAEMVGRCGPDRSPLAAVALSTDTSILTAVGNDTATKRFLPGRSKL